MRRTILAAVALAFAAPAYAQDSGTAGNITLVLTPQEAQSIWAAAAQQPYGQVAPLMEKMRGQIQAQTQPKPTVSAPVKAPDADK